MSHDYTSFFYAKTFHSADYQILAPRGAKFYFVNIYFGKQYSVIYLNVILYI